MIAPDWELGFQTLRWEGDVPGRLYLLDQTKLPQEEVELAIENIPDLVAAIQCLAVRGAPALGCAGAYGLVVGMQPHRQMPPGEWWQKLQEVQQVVRTARPTAVNLSFGVQRMMDVATRLYQERKDTPEQWTEALLEAARAFHAEDIRLCKAIGEHGAGLLEQKASVITHCNAGALATGGIGTALSVVYAAKAIGKDVSVYADETRPLLQGARLTAWELQRAGIPVTLQCDSAAATTLATGRVNAVVVGSDRIAANGDVANKIGTYGLAVLAKEHGIPFYVAAPTTTIDMECPSGGEIPIEERAAEEVFGVGSHQWAAPGIEAFNPAFDVTPARYVTAIVTERGVVHAPDADKIARHMRAND